MTNRNLNRQTRSQSRRGAPTGQGGQATPGAIEMPTPGVLSMLVPVLLPLIVLAIMLLANLSLERRPFDSLIGHTSNSPIAVSTIERSSP